MWENNDEYDPDQLESINNPSLIPRRSDHAHMKGIIDRFVTQNVINAAAKLLRKPNDKSNRMKNKELLQAPGEAIAFK